MDKETGGSSELLATITGFQWILALLAMAPPPPMLADPLRHIPQEGRAAAGAAHRWLPVYAIHALLLLVVSLYVMYVNNQSIDALVSVDQLDCITSVLSISSNVGVWLVQAVMQLTALFGHRRLYCIYAGIALLEQDICWHCQQRQSRRRPCWMLRWWRSTSRSVAPFLILLIALTYVNYFLVSNHMPTSMRLLTISFDSLIQLKALEFCVMVQLVQELLCALRRDLLHLQQRVAISTPVVIQQTGAMQHSLHVRLQVNQNLVARVWNLVNAIERYFWLPLLMLFLFNGLTITHVINWTYIRFVHDEYNSYRLMYTFITVVLMLFPCWLTQCCINTYNEFGAVLHNMKSFGRDRFWSMRLREYSLQLMHQRLLFSCGGFFDINFKFFGTIMLTITTYVVILIQFKLQAAAEHPLLHNHNDVTLQRGPRE